MTDALRAIIERKRAEVEQSKARMTFKELESLVAQADPPRNFFGAVTRHPSQAHVTIVPEIVRLDAAGRPVRPEFTADEPGKYDVPGIARRYHSAGAEAISVVTDAAAGGALEHLELARDAVPVPILRKDPIIDPWQLWESRAAGADAVLLIVDTLPEGDLVDLLILAQQLRLTAVLEVRSMDSLLRARPHIGFPHRAYGLLAINNREMAPPRPGEGGDPDGGDIAGTLRLLDLVDDLSVVVSEGGVRTRDDVVRLTAVGVRIVLAGSELLRQSDPAAALSELRTPRVR